MQTKHLKNIKQIYPDAIDISRPKISGLVHEVYIVTNPTGKFVCRFSLPETALHNLYVSKLLKSHNFIVPDISLHKFNDEYCETYPFIPGKTLHERLNEGITEKQKDKIYCQLSNISFKLSKIPYSFEHAPSVPITAKIIINFCKRFNSSPVALCHVDLLAKNILLDKEDNVFALIDLDGVYPESVAFSLVNLMQDAKRHGYDIRKFESSFKQHGIEPMFLSLYSQAKMYLIIKKIGRFLFNESLSKQLLKIKVK